MRAGTTDVLDWLRAKGYETTSKTRVTFLPPPRPPSPMMKAPSQRGPVQTAPRKRWNSYSADG